MGVIPFAFSVQHFISSVGSDAGFAAIIGLAILVLLYFAQARETASLRDQAYAAAEQVQQLEGRMAQLLQLARSQTSPGMPVPQPPPAGIVRPLATPIAAASAIPVAASSPSPVAQSSVPVPAPPAGVAAPALTAATKLIPTPGGDWPAMGHEAPALPGAAPGPWPETAGGADAPAAPIPATAAGGGNGAVREAVPRPVGGGSPGLPPPRVQIRSRGAGAAARAVGPLPRRPARDSRSGPGRGLLLILGALGAVVVVVVLLVVTSGGGPKTTPTTSRASNAPRSHRPSRQAALPPSSVTVAVLNGTATSGLAHATAVRLGAAGYKEGTIATAADQTHTATVVAYLAGRRRQALAVAGSLKLGSASVQPIDQGTQAVACPPPAPCTANVVVTVGADLASTG